MPYKNSADGKEWRRQNREKINATSRSWYARNRKQHNARTKEYGDGIRAKVFAHYGNKCQCCGEHRPEFLTIDHINNDGASHRRKIKSSGGTGFYCWVVKNGFPDFLQVLCWNCNCAKGFHGRCPHEDE